RKTGPTAAPPTRRGERYGAVPVEPPAEDRSKALGLIPYDWLTLGRGGGPTTALSKFCATCASRTERDTPGLGGSGPDPASSRRNYSVPVSAGRNKKIQRPGARGRRSTGAGRVDFVR